MATGADVMKLLRPNQGWIIIENEFESIKYDAGVIPLTKKEFEDGFAQCDALKATEAKAKATTKAALLTQLGITEEQAKLLLS